MRVCRTERKSNPGRQDYEGQGFRKRQKETFEVMDIFINWIAVMS